MSTRWPEKFLTRSHTEGRAEGLRYAERRQIATIARATFDGFIQSDLTPQGMQAPALIWAAAFLVAPSTLLTAKALVKYSAPRRLVHARLASALWDDRLTFLLLSACAIGLVSVVLWDVLFPARRDAFVLTPLPVAESVQMLGRLGGLVTLFGSFVVGLNLVPAILFPLASAPGFVGVARAIPAHTVSAVAADAFVFFTVTSVQGIVILAFGRRVAARLASAAQGGAVVAVLLTLGFMTPLLDFTREIVAAGDPSARALMLTPTAWFLGLYEYIAGSSQPGMAALAWRGLLAGVVPPAVTIAIYAFGYRRLLVRAVETPSRSTRSIVTRLGSALIRTLVVRRPQERAMVSFVFRAISRSARHSMLMSLYIGAALALVVTTIAPDIVRHGMAALATPHVAILAQPLVLSAALAGGVRILITIPAEMDARWIFRVTALRPQEADAAAHKTLLLLVLTPVVAAAGVSGWLLWGPRLAMLHAAFCGSLSLLLCEVLLIRYNAAPLTRPYVPGGSHFHTLWPVYFGVFSFYAFGMAALERQFLSPPDPGSVLKTCAVFGLIAAAIWGRRRFNLRRAPDVSFEAEIPASEMFQGFNLSEIHAASAVASHDRKP
jgi:hypothetical protein